MENWEQQLIDYIRISKSVEKNKKILQAATTLMEIYREFLKELLDHYKTPFKLRLLRFSL